MSGTNYFSYFPSTDYSFPDGTSKTAINVFKRTAITALSNTLKSSVFYKYTIKEGERVEDLADRYYGDTQYYWIILYANDIINIYSQWPKSYEQFQNYLISTYGSIEDIQDISNPDMIHHYEDADGNWISKESWITNGSLLGYAKSIYDYEYQENENKREIFIIRREYLSQIVNEMNLIFRS